MQKKAQFSGHQGAIYALEKGKDNQFWSAGGDGWIVSWQLDNPDFGQLVARTEKSIFALRYLADTQQIVAGDRDGGVHFLWLDTPEKNKHIAHHQKGVFDIQYIDNQLLTLGADGCLTRWDLAHTRSVESIQLSAKSLRAFCHLPHIEAYAIAASDGNIYIIDAKTWDVRHTIRAAHTPSVFCLSLSPDKRFLISGGRDALLKCWDILNGFELKSSVAAHLYTVNHIAFSPDNPAIFATASRDKTVKIWTFSPEESSVFTLKKVLNTIRCGGHINSVNRLLWFNNQLLSASDDRSIMLWE